MGEREGGDLEGDDGHARGTHRETYRRKCHESALNINHRPKILVNTNRQRGGQDTKDASEAYKVEHTGIRRDRRGVKEEIITTGGNARDL
jgi:hypothetical protein